MDSDADFKIDGDTDMDTGIIIICKYGHEYPHI